MKTLVLVFLYCNCNFMKADYTNDLVQSAYSLISSCDGHLTTNPLNPLECSTILNEFANYASNFTNCSIRHARPIRLCVECVEQFVNFHNKYEELLTKDVNGTLCKSLFISHDRLDAVLEYHDNILSIWEKGHCNACFDWNQKGKPKLSNNTEHYKTKFNVTMDCIVQQLNPDANNTDEVCKKCMLAYVELDEFYKSLSIDAIGVDSVCMDIVDSMNATRYIWSKVLNCCNLRRSPEIVFLFCTAIIAMLPLLFYIAVRFCGPIRDLPNVLKQSRFKQIILRSTNGRVN